MPAVIHNMDQPIINYSQKCDFSEISECCWLGAAIMESKRIGNRDVYLQWMVGSSNSLETKSVRVDDSVEALILKVVKSKEAFIEIVLNHIRVESRRDSRQTLENQKGNFRFTFLIFLRLKLHKFCSVLKLKTSCSRSLKTDFRNFRQFYVLKGERRSRPAAAPAC